MDDDAMFDLAFQAMSLNNEQKDQPKVKKKNICEECNVDLLFDEQRGIIICTECGLIKEEGVLSQEPEWNNYQNDQGKSNDNSRCTWSGPSGLYEGENSCCGTTVNRFTKNTPKYLRYTWDNSRNRSLYKVYTNIDGISAEHGIALMIIKAIYLIIMINIIKLITSSLI